MSAADRYFLKTEQLKEVEITDHISDVYNNYLILNVSSAIEVIGSVFEDQALTIIHGNGKKNIYRISIVRYLEGRLEDAGNLFLLIRFTKFNYL